MCWRIPPDFRAIASLQHSANPNSEQDWLILIHQHILNTPRGTGKGCFFVPSTLVIKGGLAACTRAENNAGVGCAHMRDKERERETGGEEDRAGVSNTLLIKVKEMFYSWRRQQQTQQWHWGQGWNEHASPFPRASAAAHRLTTERWTRPPTLINNVKAHTHLYFYLCEDIYNAFSNG